MIGLQNKFPSYSKKAVVSIEPEKEFKTISNSDHNGKWMVMFWYPKDFTFICPTEIAEFNSKYEEFAKRGAHLIGASTDSEFVHLAWRNNHPDLKNLQFPLLSDISKSLAEELGILDVEEKTAYRVTFIVNPEGEIMWINANDLDTGRNVDEVIRVLDALQTGVKTPCNWKPGEATL